MNNKNTISRWIWLLKLLWICSEDSAAFFLNVSIRYVLVCCVFAFFLPLLWQWAVNLSFLPEDGDKKTAYGSAYRLLSNRLQLFVSSADKSSLWGCFLHLDFVLYFLCSLSVITIVCAQSLDNLYISVYVVRGYSLSLRCNYKRYKVYLNFLHVAEMICTLHLRSFLILLMLASNIQHR